MAILPGNSKSKPPLWSALANILRNNSIFAIAGLVGALVSLFLFAKLTEDVFTNEITQADNNFELWVHSFANPFLDAVFYFFTTIGSITGILILTVLTFGLLVWTKHLHSAWLLVLSVGGGLVINQVLKYSFQRERPQLWLTSDNRPSTFSFTSGHSTLSLCYFGFLIWLGFKFIQRPLLQALIALLMIFFIGMVGLSRIYFGVHYPSDVLGGYLSGSFWLIALISSTAIYDRWRKPPRPEQNLSINS